VKLPRRAHVLYILLCNVYKMFRNETGQTLSTCDREIVVSKKVHTHYRVLKYAGKICLQFRSGTFALVISCMESYHRFYIYIDRAKRKIFFKNPSTEMKYDFIEKREEGESMLIYMICNALRKQQLRYYARNLNRSFFFLCILI
jgi:hypothetical protein